MNLKEICKPLEDLYSITHLDWDLSINHNLTEPTCPTIIIKPEGTNITRYMSHCNPDNIEKTLINLVKVVHTEVVEGKLIGRSNHPMTNSDDDLFANWIKGRQENKDLPFPTEDFYKRINKRLSIGYKD